MRQLAEHYGKSPHLISEEQVRQYLLYLENDKLVLTQTSIVFVPAGVAYGRMRIKNLKKPVFHYTCHTNTDKYEAFPAEATAAQGAYAESWVEKYAPVDGFLPPAPEGFLTRLLWIDDKKLSGAPYLESVWFVQI